MDFPPDSSRVVRPSSKRDAPWFQRLSRPILFLIVSLMLVGTYLAFTIPVAVFPNTDFPRIVIGIDNGVMPIDQMLACERCSRSPAAVPRRSISSSTGTAT